MFKEFKEFAMRGNVLDLAIGVIIGVAFNNVVTSAVNDVIMPPIGLAAALPVARSRCDHFTTLATLTSNSAATARQDLPPATDATTRSRGSRG